MDKTIQHTGIVDRIEGASVFVKILQQSACAGCHARSMCGASESREKLVEVTDHKASYRIGEEVLIVGRTSMGLQAVWIAFILPLIVVVAVLVYGNNRQWEEGISALSALFFLVVYYCGLYFFRDRLKKKFIFTLKKLNQ